MMNSLLMVRLISRDYKGQQVATVLVARDRITAAILRIVLSMSTATHLEMPKYGPKSTLSRGESRLRSNLWFSFAESISQTAPRSAHPFW